MALYHCTRTRTSTVAVGQKAALKRKALIGSPYAVDAVTPERTSTRTIQFFLALIDYRGMDGLLHIIAENPRGLCTRYLAVPERWSVIISKLAAYGWPWLDQDGPLLWGPDRWSSTPVPCVG